LLGNATAVIGKGSGRVLTTGSTDNIFIYFSDHGAPGLVAFPSSYFYASDLIATFTTMHQKNLYKRIVMYLEACEAGSMFVNLNPSWRIYALSAANPTESSYAYYCGSNAVVSGVNINSCLGDEFSVKFLEDTDNHNISTESLKTQFLNVKAATVGSHVMQWGDLSFQTSSVNSVMSKGGGLLGWLGYCWNILYLEDARLKIAEGIWPPPKLTSDRYTAETDPRRPWLIATEGDSRGIVYPPTE